MISRDHARLTQRWLADAANDLRVAARLLQPMLDGAPYQICAHCQMAAEKAFTAATIFAGWTPDPSPGNGRGYYTHQLRDLAARLPETYRSRGYSQAITTLDTYGPSIRYPSANPPDRTRAQHALRQAGLVLHAVQRDLQRHGLPIPPPTGPPPSPETPAASERRQTIPMDGTRRTLTLLRYAQANRRTAERLLALGDDFTSQSCFWAQQAAETAIKAALSWHAREDLRWTPPHSHDLDHLRSVLPPDWTTRLLTINLRTLSSYAVDARYQACYMDAGIAPPTPAEARRALLLTRDLLTQIRIDLRDHGMHTPHAPKPSAPHAPNTPAATIRPSQPAPPGDPPRQQRDR